MSQGTGDGPDRRFPRWVYGEGSEPDPRFSLANERTFLAWIRTALALVAAGVALEALAAPLSPTLRSVTADLLVGLGTVTPLGAWVHWGRTERAMRRGVALPASVLRVVLALGAVVAGALILVALHR